MSLASEFPNDNPALHHGVIWVCREPTGRAEPERVIDPQLVAILEADDPTELIVEELEPLEVVSVEGEVASIVAPPIVVEEVVFAPPLPPPPIEEEVAPTVEPAAISEVVLCGGRGDEAIVVDELPPSITPAFEEIAPTKPAPVDSTALPPASDDPFTILVCTLADVAIGAGSPHIASILPGLLFDGRLPEPLDADIAETLRGAGLLDANGNEMAQTFAATTRAWREILRGTSDDFDACGAAMLDEWASDLLARLLNAPAKQTKLRQELRTRGVAAFGLAA